MTARRRVLKSIANFWVGQVLRLRPDMGGGWWRIVELLPPDNDKLGLCAALAEEVLTMRRTGETWRDVVIRVGGDVAMFDAAVAEGDDPWRAACRCMSENDRLGFSK